MANKHKYDYFYDKGNNTIFKIIYVKDNQFQWLSIAGNNVDTSWWSGGYDKLLESPNIIFGDLETLKVLYVKV